MDSRQFQQAQGEPSQARQYSAEDRQIWSELVTQQDGLLQGQTPAEYQEGRELLGITADDVPSIPDLNDRLADLTGFQIKDMKSTSKPKEFFGLLAKRKFPVQSHVRPREEFYSVDWPDLFHEVYGHGPFLANPSYADFLEGFGAMGKSLDPSLYWQMFRLFWFTAEFGLIADDDGRKILGAGILSSIQEVKHLGHPSQTIKPFDLLTALRTPYEISFPQPHFYYIGSFSELSDMVSDGLEECLAEARALGDLTKEELLAS